MRKSMVLGCALLLAVTPVFGWWDTADQKAIKEVIQEKHRRWAETWTEKAKHEAKKTITDGSIIGESQKNLILSRKANLEYDSIDFSEVTVTGNQAVVIYRNKTIETPESPKEITQIHKVKLKKDGKWKIMETETRTEN